MALVDKIKKKMGLFERKWYDDRRVAIRPDVPARLNAEALIPMRTEARRKLARQAIREVVANTLRDGPSWAKVRLDDELDPSETM